MAKTNRYGVYFIFKSMEQGPSFLVSVPKYPSKDPHYRILARGRSRFTHYYFYIRDETLGPMVLRVASFFPFQTTYYLNGHSFIAQELNRAQVGFRKNDNAVLAVDDVAALQAAADRPSPAIIRKRLDYWTFVLGPKFAAKARKALNLSRSYAIAQIEYCRNPRVKPGGTTFQSTSCSSAAANSACGGSPPTRSPPSSAPASTAGTAASSSPSSIRSSMAIMSCAPTSRMPCCGSTRSSQQAAPALGRRSGHCLVRRLQRLHRFRTRGTRLSARA